MPADTRTLFDVEQIETAISEGRVLDVKDESGSTYLHLAVESQNYKLVELLLEYGVSPNATDNSASTYLHLAVKSQNYKLVKLLLQYGASPNAKDNSGSTPLNYAAQGREERREERIVQLLLNYWADPNNKDNSGLTPLHNVALGGSVAIAKLLLDFGADRNAQDKDGKTPLDIAAAGHPAIVRLLLGESLPVVPKKVATTPELPITINGNYLDDSTGPSEDASKTNYILIQTKARLSPPQTQDLENARVTLVEYVSEHTYLCGYQGVGLEEIRQLEPVVYVDVYREELKVAPGLGESDTSIKVDVVFHRGVDLSAEDLRDRIAKTSGLDLAAIQFCGHKARLTVPGPRISQIATIDEVRYIEPVGVIVLW
ncbi:hypothetical protein Hte_012079 [Hypoxylon texense]